MSNCSFTKLVDTARRLSENALFSHLFVNLEKIILGILTICLR
jgi:hypothetical protein